jgi:hypothetical protein
MVQVNNNNKRIFLMLLFSSLIVLQLPISNAASILYNDAWDMLYGGTSDAVVWGDFNLYAYASSVDTEADCLCWDWDDDGSDDNIIANWDNCYCESGQKQQDCVSYSSLVYTVCDNGDCTSDVSLTEWHFTDTGSDGDHWREYRDIREYRDCDNSAGERGIYNWEGQEGRPYWVVYRHQYDCDSDPGPSTDPDYEGDYGGWVDIDSNTGMCYSWEECDENHDESTSDGTRSSIYNEVLNSPCRTKSGYSCSSDDDCLSDNCCNGYCLAASASETSCTDSTDNDCDGYTDCDDSDCEGQTGPNGKICCNDGAYNCGTCKYCSSDQCESRATGYVCNSDYYCSNYPGGDNSFNTGANRIIPSQGQCDASQTCDYSSSSPVCGYAEGASQEATGSTICQDAYSTCRNTCSDGIDNNGNGCTDGNDYACGGTETNCNNGVDDDCDGFTDSADTDDCGVSTDLQILDVIPIQVVPGVPMVKDKTGIVKVIAKNNGPNQASGTVSVKFNDQNLNPDGSATKSMPLYQNVTFYFTFKPTIIGTNLLINATIVAS